MRTLLLFKNLYLVRCCCNVDRRKISSSICCFRIAMSFSWNASISAILRILTSGKNSWSSKNSPCTYLIPPLTFSLTASNRDCSIVRLRLRAVIFPLISETWSASSVFSFERSRSVCSVNSSSSFSNRSISVVFLLYAVFVVTLLGRRACFLAALCALSFSSLFLRTSLYSCYNKYSR